VKIWDYVDPDKAENEIKENTEPDIPSIAVAPTAAPAAQAAAPAVTPASTGTAIPGSSSQQGQQNNQQT
jgi:hypothetical protein